MGDYRIIVGASGIAQIRRAGLVQMFRDFAFGGPELEFPVYEWNGSAFAPSRMISDTEFPASLN